MRLDLFVKLKYESNTIILFVGIRYSVRDLCEFKCLNYLLDGYLCKNIFYFHIFLIFKHDYQMR